MSPAAAASLLGGFVTVGFAFLFGIKSTAAHAVIMFFLTLLVAALLLVVFEFNEPFAGVVRVTPRHSSWHWRAWQPSPDQASRCSTA